MMPLFLNSIIEGTSPCAMGNQLGFLPEHSAKIISNTDITKQFDFINTVG